MTLGCVDEEDDTVDHGQCTLDLTTEVGVARGIDNVDRHAVGGAVLRGRGAAVRDRRVLREDRDALLALEVTGVHDTLTRGFDGGVGVEDVRLPQHGIDQGCLAMIDVGDDGDVANI